MCGIVYSKSFTGKTVNKTIAKRFKAQKHRGVDGFGFYLPETNQLLHNTKQGRTLALLRRTKATEMLFHHRLPTSTVNIRNACHPFSTKDNFDHNYVVVHNGVLHNEDELMVDHYARGIEYVSMQPDGKFNDSEALAYDIALYLEGKQNTIKATGSIAFIAVKRHKNGNAISLIYGRNSGNPLVKKVTKHSMTLSSEGEGEEIKANTIYEYNYDTGKTTESYAVIKTSNYSGSTGYATPKGSTRPYGSTFGEYEDYQNGYNWDGYTDEDIAVLERMEVKEMYDDIMNDYDFDAWNALDASQGMLELFKAQEQELWSKAWDEGGGVNGELNAQYDESEHNVKVLQKVVAKIRGEAFGRQTEMGFQPRRLNATNQGGAK